MPRTGWSLTLRGKAAVICLFLLAIFLRADAVGGDKEQLDLAFLLVERTGGSKIFLDLAESFMEPYFERYSGSFSGDAEAANPLRTLLMDEFKASEEELKWNMAEIYASHFSEAELREIVRFFNSPAGKAWFDNYAVILAEGEQLGYEWAKILTERVLHKFEASSGEKIRRDDN